MAFINSGALTGVDTGGGSGDINNGGNTDGGSSGVTGATGGYTSPPASPPPDTPTPSTPTTPTPTPPDTSGTIASFIRVVNPPITRSYIRNSGVAVASEVLTVANDATYADVRISFRTAAGITVVPSYIDIPRSSTGQVTISFDPGQLNYFQSGVNSAQIFLDVKVQQLYQPNTIQPGLPHFLPVPIIPPVYG